MFILQLFVLLVMVQGNNMIKLPVPDFTDVSLEKCIEARRSIRSYQDKALDLNQISLILWAAQGVTDKDREFRAAPSAGATYPLEIYACTHDGVYHYIPQSHGIKRINENDVRKEIAHAALNQMFIADAGMVIVITALYDRTTGRYGERGVQYVHIEVGHVAQNIHLQAVALGLGSVPIGAYNDEKVQEILDLDEEYPLYIIPIGYIE